MVEAWVFQEIDPFLHNRPEYSSLPALYRGYSYDNQRFIFTLKSGVGGEPGPDVGRTVNVLVPEGIAEQFEEPNDAATWVMDQLRMQLTAHGFLKSYNRPKPTHSLPVANTNDAQPVDESYEID